MLRVFRKTMSSFAASAADPLATASVLLDKLPHARILTLNRPKALNALSLPMVRDLSRAYGAAEQSEHTNVVILKGAGDKAFCAGGDVKAVAADPVKVGLPFFREEYVLDYAIGTLSKQHVALLDGITMGGGVGISVHGAFRIATDATVFAMPETAIGFFPDVGGSHFLPRLAHGAAFGMFLALTGCRLKGAEVCAAGVATHYVPRQRVNDLVHRLGHLSSGDYRSVRMAIEEFSDSIDSAQLGGLTRHLGAIERCFDPKKVDSVSGVLALLAEESGEDKAWAQQQIKTLSHMSPTSLAVTFEQIRRGGQLSLAECLKMEFRIAHRMMSGKDFFEGVRAMLVAKDNAPKWEAFDHASGAAKKAVVAYFEPLSANEELQLDVQKESRRHALAKEIQLFEAERAQGNSRTHDDSA